TMLDRARIADYQRMGATVRAAGIRAELYLGSGKFSPQMKYADRRRSPCVIIQGSDEKQRGEVQIKDLIVGAELAGLSKERDDYLRKQAEAQFAVPEDKLVEAGREVLARHGEDGLSEARVGSVERSETHRRRSNTVPPDGFRFAQPILRLTPSGSLHGAVGAKGMDGEVILRIEERCGAGPSGAAGAAAERLHGGFVAVLGVKGLAAAEVERLAAGANLLPRQTDEMHLDAALFGVVARVMAEGGRVELAAKLVIDAHEQIEVEGGRNPGIVIIGR